MKYIDEFRNKDLVMNLAAMIEKTVTRNYNFMEVCGGHTSAIHRFGIPSLLPDCVKLISGPGCPVCVTGTDYIDKAIGYSGMDQFIICTFGDLLRVPGTDTSLEKMRACGSDVRIVVSGLEALEIARTSPGRKVLFLGIGFETTAPGTAVTIMLADKESINNFYLLSAHKIMPPVMKEIISNSTNIDGFICPGHVATITGSNAFNFIPEESGLSCVITGFEPVDILLAILMLIKQVNNKFPKVEIQYNRAVTPDGNSRAMKYLHEVFEPCSVKWRGFGLIPESGLRLRKDFMRFDIENFLDVKISGREENELCICGKILRGLSRPDDCLLFADVCNPENPVGACMVSNEGACNSWYKYRL